MIDVVINYDAVSGYFKIYEPTTDTLLVSASLTESFVQLSDFLQSQGFEEDDILRSQDINYHLDSATFISMIESNVSLRKRLSEAKSGFALSENRFGSSSQPTQRQSGGGKTPKRQKSGTFSHSNFGNSYKKFGSK